MKLTRKVFFALVVLFFIIINLSSCGRHSMSAKSSSSTRVLGEMDFDFKEKDNNKRKLKKEKKQ